MDPVTFTCDWCGKEFPADARTMVETGLALAVDGVEPDEAWKGEDVKRRTTIEDYNDLTPDERQMLMDDMELTEEELKNLFEKGEALNGVSCVCIQCQDESEQEEEE